MVTNYFIIGIGGVTNGGKTTLCSHLCQTLQDKGHFVTVLNMDDYYWPEESPNHVLLEEFNNTYANWDDVCAVDWERLIDDVKCWKEDKERLPDSHQQHFLLLEGIMVFNHGSLLPFYKRKYFLTLPKDVCWDRRRLRHYLPPEPDGYYEAIAWPYYLKLKTEIGGQDDIVYLDGSSSQDAIFQTVYKDIIGLVNTT